MKERFNMSIDTRVVALPYAVGTIEAQGNQMECFDEFIEDIRSGEFHVPTDKAIPCKCIDGRCSKGYSLEGPNSAGGMLSLVVADDITRKKFSDATGTISGSAKNVALHLQQRNLPVGLHSDDHASAPNSGCGANDKLNEIYMNMGRFEDDIKATAAQILGFIPREETNDLIFNNVLDR